MKNIVLAFVLLSGAAHANELGPAVVWTMVIVPSPPARELGIFGVYFTEEACNTAGPQKAKEHESVFPGAPVTFRCDKVQRR